MSGMDNDMIQGRWNEIKSKIRSKWGKISNSDIEKVKNNLDELSTKIQKAYGCAKAQAEREYHEFRLSLRPMMKSSSSRH